MQMSWLEVRLLDAYRGSEKSNFFCSLNARISDNLTILLHEFQLNLTFG